MDAAEPDAMSARAAAYERSIVHDTPCSDPRQSALTGDAS